MAMASPVTTMIGFENRVRVPLAWAPPGQGRKHLRTGKSRIVCIGGDRHAREEAARKALEQALGEKKEAFSKWDEEIKRRESRGTGGGGKGRWGGFGGGGGGGSGNGDPVDDGSWNEAKQIVFAFTGLVGVYLLLTNGRRSLVFILNLPRYMARGGRKTLAFIINLPLLIIRGLKQVASKRQQEHLPSEPPAVTAAPQQSAKAHVLNKWGRD